MRIPGHRRILRILCLALFLPGTASAQNDQDALWNYRTGRDLESRNRLSEAQVHYTETIRICYDEIVRDVANSDTYTAMTWALQRQQRYQEVISWGERGLLLHADEYRILETMGEAYFYLDNFDESLRFMQRYTNSVPQGERSSVAYFFIGEIYRYKGLFHHADIAYSTAVRLEPYAALWWYRLGTVREAARDFLQAANAYEQALRLNPDYQEANAGLERTRR